MPSRVNHILKGNAAISQKSDGADQGRFVFLLVTGKARDELKKRDGIKWPRGAGEMRAKGYGVGFLHPESSDFVRALHN